MPKKIHRFVIVGGWGDMLLSTPIFKTLKENNPSCKIFLYCTIKDRREIFKNNPYIDKVSPTTWYTNLFVTYLFIFKKNEFYHLNYAKSCPSLFPKEKAADIIAQIAKVELSDRRIQLFITPKEDELAKRKLKQYKNPICVQSSSFSRNKCWPIDNWELLVAVMPDYTFIQLGETDDEKIKGAIDLCGKTTFRMSAAFIKNSISFLGSDSCLAHVASAFNIPGVALFGPTTPITWGHSSNVNIYKAIRCSPCIDILGEAKCPYNRKCMSLISVDDVKEALLTQLTKVNSCI